MLIYLPFPITICRVGAGRVAHVSVCTFPHTSLRTGRATFTASGSPVLRCSSGDLATDLALWVAYLSVTGSAERDQVLSFMRSPRLVRPDVMHFYAPAFAAHLARPPVPFEHRCSHGRPSFAVEACSPPFPFPWVGIVVVGEVDFFRRVQVRVGTVSIALPFYFHEDTGVVEFLSTGDPCGIVCGFAIILPVDCSYPSARLLAEPDFHSFKGVMTDVCECSTGGLMPEVVCPAPKKIIHCLNLVPDGIEGGSSFGHGLDFGFELHHAFLTRPDDEVTPPACAVVIPFHREAKEVVPVGDVRDVRLFC